MLRLRHPVSLVLISILVLFGVLRSFSSPEPRDADSPDVVFSAIRAEAILRDLLQENVPHVSGSPYNLVIRNRLIAHLQDYGYEPEIQSLFHCNIMSASCSPVDNVIAVKPGTVGKGAVLLTSHYDSVWTGPGAADAGAGTAAVLEIARMAADFPPFENDIIFLISDSEENGLIGADAFARQHPLFEKVKTVINLEARGVAGTSAMFETGEGNRRIIRLFSQNTERPMGNSLSYEIYKRMPNDTDFSVYKARGVSGLNFAFTKGVAVYHSAIDDPDHLDLGSLQHHGDNAWGVLKALADRNLDRFKAKEDAGYIDLFGFRLVHYPESIALGLALVLGVLVLFSIGLAFRKDFRYRQLRWGIVVVPFLVLGMVLGGWLLSFPLGIWPELHPIEHPYPWMGRFALFLMVVLLLYLTLRIFRERISPCAMLIVSWSLIFILGMVLASNLPTASHLALIPLLMFVMGSIVDLVRKKSPAPLLMASVLGFAATAFISLYHFLLLDAVLNFDHSHLKVIPLILMTLTILPMLLVFVKDRPLTWQPARWLLVAILLCCLVHLSLPGYTADRPRGMSLVYSEEAGAENGYLVLESFGGTFDRRYAEDHGFGMIEMNTGWPQPVERPARTVAALALPDLTLTGQGAEKEDSGWKRRMQLQVPAGTLFLRLIVPLEIGLEKAWINGLPVLDKEQFPREGRPADTLRIIYPGEGPFEVELLTSQPGSFELTATTWQPMPEVLAAPFLGDWPANAQPLHYGPRATRLQTIVLPAAEDKENNPGSME
jgi:hypothetical protein